MKIFLGYVFIIIGIATLASLRGLIEFLTIMEDGAIRVLQDSGLFRFVQLNQDTSEEDTETEMAKSWKDVMADMAEPEEQDL